MLTNLAPGSVHAAPLLLDWMDDRFAAKPMKRVRPSDHPDYEVVEGLNAVEITVLVLGILGVIGAVYPHIQPYL